MEIKKLQDRIHNQAVSMGWWGEKRTPLEIHALIHSEVSEATESVRNNEPSTWQDDGKPCGEAVEIADVIIRCLDYAGYMGWDLGTIIDAKLKYNLTRGHRHGGKKA
jgi:NTP pyrophosphatase (non-canonical NTP hydrolase)